VLSAFCRYSYPFFYRISGTIFNFLPRQYRHFTTGSHEPN
jgi:hypothetical protein